MLDFVCKCNGREGGREGERERKRESRLSCTSTHCLFRVPVLMLRCHANLRYRAARQQARCAAPSSACICLSWTAFSLIGESQC